MLNKSRAEGMIFQVHIRRKNDMASKCYRFQSFNHLPRESFPQILLFSFVRRCKFQAAVTAMKIDGPLRRRDSKEERSLCFPVRMTVAP